MDYKMRDEMMAKIDKRFEASKDEDFKAEMKNDLDVEDLDKKALHTYTMALATYIGYATEMAQREITSTTIDEMRAHNSAIGSLVMSLKQALQETEKRSWGHSRTRTV